MLGFGFNRRRKEAFRQLTGLDAGASKTARLYEPVESDVDDVLLSSTNRRGDEAGRVANVCYIATSTANKPTGRGLLSVIFLKMKLARRKAIGERRNL